MNHNLSFESLIFVIMRVIFIYTPEAMMVHTENSNKIKILWMSILLFAVLSTFYCQNTPTSPPVYINRALSFDGMDDIVTVPAVGTMLDSLSTQFTIESWIYIRSYRSRAPRIVDRSDNTYGAPAGDRIVFGLFEPDSSVHLNINGYATRSDKLPLDEWIHVAGTFDGQVIRIYVNGQLSNSSFYSGTIHVTESDLYIGNNDFSTRQFDGLIDEIRIWSLTKSQVELQSTMFLILSGNESGLIAYWPLDEGSGQEIKDNSQNSIHGCLGSNQSLESLDPVWINRTQM